MVSIDSGIFDIGRMDTLAQGKSSLHRLDPRAKLITTLVFVLTVVSFGKYEISALIPYFLFPAVLMALGDLPMAYIAKKLLVVAPFAVLMGIFNPLIDSVPVMQIHGVTVSGGWVSYASILIRFVLTVSAALILIALTGFNAVCLALLKLGTPKVFVVQLLFLYRYLFVLMDEASRMVRARALRALNGAGTGLKTFGPLVGHLLLRTLDRAQRIHTAMCCRGFDGRIRMLRPMAIGSREIAFMLGWTALFVFLRIYNVPRLLGLLVTELLA